MRYSVVIPAAGQGKRMNLNENKLFLLLEDKPVIIHTLEIFQNDDWCEEIIVAANESEKEQIGELTKSFGISKIKRIVTGGKERQQSVYNGLKALNGDVIVLIHDGARPFVKTDHIHELVKVASDNEAAILAVPIKDTIKESSDKKVTRTVDRANLWSVQTPQAFQLKAILEAHEWAEQKIFLGTDDSSLMEGLNKKISVVIGDYYNIKLTTREDIIFAEAILQMKRGSVH